MCFMIGTVSQVSDVAHGTFVNYKFVEDKYIFPFLNVNDLQDHFSHALTQQREVDGLID